MNCSYKLSESEVVKAMQLHGRGSKNALIILCVIGIILILIAVFTDHKAIAIAAIVGGILGGSFVFFGLTPFKAKKQYKENRALKNKITVEMIDQGVNFKSESGESRLKWSDIHKWKSSKGIYLMYITSNIFYIVPSRALKSEESLEALLNKNVGSKKE